MGNSTEADKKVAGNDNLMQHATISIIGNVLLSKACMIDQVADQYFIS